MDIHPKTRLVLLLLWIPSALLSTNFILLSFAILVYTLPLIIIFKVYKPYFSFIAKFILPLFTILTIVYGYLLGSPPNKIPGSDPYGGVVFSATIIVKLILLTSIFHLSLLTMNKRKLISTFRCWGLNKELTFIFVNAFNTYDDWTIKAKQVIEARMARGMYRKNRKWQHWLDIPYLLKPLTFWAISAALNRANYLNERDLLYRIELNNDYFSYSYKDYLHLSFTIFWILLIIT